MCTFSKHSPRQIRQTGNERRLNRVILERASPYRTQALLCWERSRGFPKRLLILSRTGGGGLSPGYRQTGNWAQVPTVLCPRACVRERVHVCVTVFTSGAVTAHHESWFCFLDSGACGLARTKAQDFATAVCVTWEGNEAATGVIFISFWARVLPAKRPCSSARKTIFASGTSVES